MTFAILPAGNHASTDTLTIDVDGTRVDHREERSRHQGRLVVLEPPAGTLTIALDSSIPVRASFAAEPNPDRYLDSSPYVDVAAVASSADQFADLEPADALDAIVTHLRATLRYEPELSAIDDAAHDTLRKRGGMCRDWAHAAIALLRANGIPARYVSVYAPGLQPPDFHAVVEAHIDDRWLVVDPTDLSRTDQLIRIATGTDASETAWLDSDANRTVTSMTIHADADEPSIERGATELT